MAEGPVPDSDRNSPVFFHPLVRKNGRLEPVSTLVRSSISDMIALLSSWGSDALVTSALGAALADVPDIVPIQSDILRDLSSIVGKLIAREDKIDDQTLNDISDYIIRDYNRLTSRWYDASEAGSDSEETFNLLIGRYLDVLIVVQRHVALRVSGVSAIERSLGELAMLNDSLLTTYSVSLQLAVRLEANEINQRSVASQTQTVVEGSVVRKIETGQRSKDKLGEKPLATEHFKIISEYDECTGRFSEDKTKRFLCGLLLAIAVLDRLAIVASRLIPFTGRKA